MNLHGFGMDFSDSGALMPGGLWQPVAESCGPYTLPCSVLGAGRLAGWQAGRMVGWWLAGWLNGWMAGCMDGWM